MKIGNLILKWHKHEWKKVVIYAQENYSTSLASGGYLLKVGEECTHKDCDAGHYRSVYYIILKEKPEVIKID